MKLLKLALPAMLAAVMLSCAAPQPGKQELLLGTWATSLDGQPVTLTYSEDEVTVREINITMHYEWIDADHIRLDVMGQEVVSEVEFESSDRMIQTGEAGRRIFTRVQ